MVTTRGLPGTDLTGRMAVFGRLFAERAGLLDPAEVPTATDLVALVRLHIPRVADASEQAPVFEAAAYMGEWLRIHANATWIAEGPFEPHLQITDRDRTVIYLVPIVSVLRTATTAGYDGLGRLLGTILKEVAVPLPRVAIEDVRVHPREDGPAVAAWIVENRGASSVTRAALWRRCAVCAHDLERTIEMPAPTVGWEAEAGMAAAMLAHEEAPCECGGLPGDVSRFLMIRAEPDGLVRFGDIYVTPTHTRVACWRLEGEEAVPLDASELAREP